jgi:4-amino-4-deoxy-L-arabinose transferase-like glycosyltransferase
MNFTQPRFLPLAAKAIVCHTITYFVMGALAAHYLHWTKPLRGKNQADVQFVAAGDPSGFDFTSCSLT